MDSEIQAQQDPAATEATDRADDPRLRPYRNWAMQNNPISALGADTTWGGRERSDHAVVTSEDPRGGQGLLLNELEPDPEFQLRTRTSLVIWGAALLTGAANQFGSIGVVMPSDSYKFTLTWALFALVFTAVAYPRLRPRPFAMIEQLMLASGFAVIVFKCHETGGALSPYAVWWMFSTFYAAYFFPQRRAFANVAVISLLMLAPAVYDPAIADGATPIVMVLLLAVTWMLALTLVARRETSRGAERAVRYLALSDPLTGVANLRLFERSLDRALGDARSPFGVVMADMNGLNGANVVYGYGEGDDMLCRLAALLCHASGPQDQVARVRGDEFAVILPGAGAAEVESWRRRFEIIVDTHNGWVRNRRPRISVAVGTAVFPHDGITSTELIEKADRRMFDQKSSTVLPPYEVDVTTGVDAERMMREPEPPPMPSLPEMLGSTSFHAATRWLIAAGFLFSLSVVPNDVVSSSAGVALLGVYALAMALVSMAIRADSPSDRAYRISDLGTIAVIAPLMMVSGGWQSPLQLAIFFPVAFYAQFLEGVQAVKRVAAVIGLYGFAYWTSGPLGFADAHVDRAGHTLFATILTALFVIALMLNVNRRQTDAAVATIRDAAVRDPLTGVNNLPAFRRRLAEDLAAARDSADSWPRPALTVADIDDLRRINSFAGHLGGDAALRELARQLIRLTESHGTVFRIGSDEFVLVHQADDLGHAESLAKTIRESLRIELPKRSELEVPVTVSVGQAVWRPGMSAEQLVQAAERDLSERKERERPTYPAYGEGKTLL
ncbi:MAG: GGDEF domain-containing protein [Actinobacteria bacterium]|nr:GGDEF domain-containing protein [Actinomycetota bacterium]